MCTLLQRRPLVYSLMLRQIRTVREPLPAFVTHIRFRASVHVHMTRQRRLDREALPTHLAYVLLRPSVRRLVVLELLFRHERTPTARVPTSMRLVPGVTVDVSTEFGFVAEGFALGAAGPVAVVISTRLASRRSAGVVGADVRIQIGRGWVVVVARRAIGKAPVAAVTPGTEGGFASQSAGRARGLTRVR